MALVAANRLGSFWEFLLYSYERFDAFCVKKLPEWAGAVGLDLEKYQALAVDKGVRDQLVASKKEGIVNRVDATPTFFINGRKYAGELNYDELVDVLEEEFDRVTGVKLRQ